MAHLEERMGPGNDGMLFRTVLRAGCGSELLNGLDGLLKGTGQYPTLTIAKPFDLVSRQCRRQ
jgi:hypothetical protein